MTDIKCSGRASYKTDRELKEAVVSYFDSISKVCTVSDGKGNPILNELGEKVSERRFFVTPSLSGLCAYLGVPKSEWDSLKKRFPNASKTAETVLEAYLEEELINRKTGVTGIMFNLQNNFGWKDKKECRQDDSLSVTVKVVE